MTILVVDDEPRLRQALARTLAAHGHAVHQAGTCREAILAAAGRQVDVMVLDVNLPDATGWDVLRELRAQGREIPVVIVSAVPPNAARIREFGPVGVLHKPFPVEALLRLIRSTAGRASDAGGGNDDESRPPRRAAEAC